MQSKLIVIFKIALFIGITFRGTTYLETNVLYCVHMNSVYGDENVFAKCTTLIN